VKILQSLQHQIYIGDGSVSLLKEFTKQYAGEQIVVIADENTYRHCYSLLWHPTSTSKISFPFSSPKKGGSPAGERCLEIGRAIIIPSGEDHKNLTTTSTVLEQLLRYQINRNGLIINLGGGVVGDLGGFCASIWKRGIDFIQVPTSLLAMIDASCGGKNGINLDGIKNQIGTFKQPHAVIVDPSFLKTLPQREFISGIAEMLKHAIISKDKSHFYQLSEIKTPTIENITPQIEQSITIKNEIVLQDPYEKNIRKVLNFGHTFGHAIETWSQTTNYPLLHGEAIALGMIYEIHLAHHLQLISKATTTHYLSFIQKFFSHLGTILPTTDVLINIILHDKKNNNRKISFVLPLENGGFDLDVRVDLIEESFFLKKSSTFANINFITFGEIKS